MASLKTSNTKVVRKKKRSKCSHKIGDKNFNWKKLKFDLKYIFYGFFFSTIIRESVL